MLWEIIRNSSPAGMRSVAGGARRAEPVGAADLAHALPTARRPNTHGPRRSRVGGPWVLLLSAPPITAEIILGGRGRRLMAARTQGPWMSRQITRSTVRRPHAFIGEPAHRARTAKLAVIAPSAGARCPDRSAGRAGAACGRTITSTYAMTSHSPAPMSGASRALPTPSRKAQLQEARACATISRIASRQRRATISAY